MAAFYKTTLRAVPAYALLFLLLAIFGNALRIAHGHLHPTQLPILTIAIFGIGGFFVLSGNIVHPTLKMERWLSGLWLLFSVFLVLDNEIIYGQLSGAHRLLNVGLWLNAILSLYLWAAMFFADELDPYWQRWAMAALVLWLGILVVVPYASPSPNIDVFHHGLEAVNYLLDGKNPYSSPLSDLYHGAYGYIPGYIYLPVILVANTIAHLLFGDIRHTYIVSQLVVVFFLWRLGRERGLSPVASSFLALVWISFPVTLFVLEQSWNDTLLIAFCAPLAWSLNRQTINNSPKNWITTAIFLGLAVGTKQYAVVIAWVTILYVWQRFGMSTALRVAFLALAVLLATILPFFLLDPQAFIDHPILEIAGYRIRGDSMSWVAYILASSGFESFGSMILQVYLLVVGAVTLWFVHLRKVSLFHWAWAIILIYGGFFLFGKQAFCNYYYFLAFFVVLAIPFACGHVRDNGQDEKESMAVSEIGDAWVFPPTLFWSLLVLAIVLRLTFLDGIEFKQDEFNAIVLAYRHLALDGMAQVGLKSSTGLFNPPFFVYLMALPVFFTTDPASVTLFVIVLNLLGIYLLFRLLKWAFSLGVAVLTTLLFASSPWSILYSRKIWAQDCLFPFMVALVAVLLSLSEKYRPWKVWTLFLLLAVVTQLHMSAWFLPPAIVLFMLRFRVAVAWRDLAIGLVLLLAVYYPYIQFHMQTHFQNIIDAIHLMGQQGQNLPAGNFIWMFLISSGLGYTYVLGNEGFARFWDSYFLALPHGFFLLFFLLAVLGLVRVLASHWPLKTLSFANQATLAQKTVTLFLLMLLIIQGAYLLLDIPPFPHYAIIFFPSLFLFAVLMLQRMGSRLRVGLRKKILVTVVTGMVAANLYFTLTFHSFVLYNPQHISGDYGVPYFVHKKEWQQLLQVPQRGEAQ